MNTTFYQPRYKNDGKILAFADVDLADGVIVRGFRVMRGENGLFASVPSKSFTVEGKTRYAPQVVFASPDVRARFLSGLLEAYHQWERGRSGTPPGAPECSHPPSDELVE